MSTVSTHNMDRDEWLKLRNTGIGGSDAATVLGLNPYKSAFELYLEKIGELGQQDLSDNQAVHFGNVLEDVVAQEYRDRTGNKVQRSNQFHRSDKHEWLVANIDRRVVGKKRILECKTAGQYMASDWGPGNTIGPDGEYLTTDDNVPMTYFLQVMHYMGVLGVKEADLAVLIGGRDLRIYSFTFDEELWTTMLNAYADFWLCVQTRTSPPEFDPGHRTAEELIDRIYPEVQDGRIDLAGDIDSWCDVLEDAQARVTQYSKVVDAAKAHIRYESEGCHIAVTPAGRLFEAKMVKRKGFVVEPVEARVFAQVKGEKTKAKLLAKYDGVNLIEGEAV